MDNVYNILNKLKWTGKLKEARICIVHRGALNNKKIIKGEEVREVKKGYFTYGNNIYIPNHRVIYISLGDNILWSKGKVFNQY